MQRVRSSERVTAHTHPNLEQGIEDHHEVMQVLGEHGAVPHMHPPLPRRELCQGGPPREMILDDVRSLLDDEVVLPEVLHTTRQIIWITRLMPGVWGHLAILSS